MKNKKNKVVGYYAAMPLTATDKREFNLIIWVAILAAPTITILSLIFFY